MSGDNHTPKVLHYCWFGGKPVPRKALATVDRWHELMPDYQIIRWDESNFDIYECPYARDAYKAGKWAFVSDYVRFKVVYDHGGTYMDIGSELLKSIDPLVKASGFTACDFESHAVSPGLVLSARAHCDLLGEVLDSYHNLDFEDSIEFLYSHTVNQIFGEVLERHGYQWGVDALWEYDGFRVYPSEYFCPKLDFGGFKCTENTYSTHISSASWLPANEQFRVGFINKWAPYVGDFIARKVARALTFLKYRKDDR
ncbi:MULTISPECIES: glycosyltransferase family 32 protein [unclassified Collinsella]|uniref:glycosyltransferase family 32 protein n=1 Tax=unclassified Collinsella TaxID=2637548 RepID=UPI003F8FBDF2